MWRPLTISATNRLWCNIILRNYFNLHSKSCALEKACLKRNQHSSVLPVNVTAFWQQKLQSAGIPDPEYSIKWIAKHTERIIIEQRKRPNSNRLKFDFINEFERLCKRRLEREPVQYIVGDWDFRSLTLVMKPPVFIPRPETEGLVELVNDNLMKSRSSDCKILEVGCGSGAISLSLVKENQKVSCIAIDVSKEAVDLSKLNCERQELTSRCEIYHCSYDDYLKEQKTKEAFDLIISNPPYIPRRDMMSLQPEVSWFEDKRALHGGETGLDLVNEILATSHLILKKEGLVWLEVDSSHPPMIRDIVQREYGDKLRFVASYMDVYDRPRFCQLQRI